MIVNCGSDRTRDSEEVHTSRRREKGKEGGSVRGRKPAGVSGVSHFLLVPPSTVSHRLYYVRWWWSKTREQADMRNGRRESMAAAGGTDTHRTIEYSQFSLATSRHSLATRNTMSGGWERENRWESTYEHMAKRAIRGRDPCCSIKYIIRFLLFFSVA